MEWPFWFLVVDDDDDTELLRVQKCNLNKRSVKENAFFLGRRNLTTMTTTRVQSPKLFGIQSRWRWESFFRSLKQNTVYEKSLQKSHFTIKYKHVTFLDFLVIFKHCASLSGIRHVILFTDNDLFPCWLELRPQTSFFHNFWEFACFRRFLATS